MEKTNKERLEQCERDISDIRRMMLMLVAKVNEHHNRLSDITPTLNEFLEWRISQMTHPQVSKEESRSA